MKIPWYIKVTNTKVKNNNYIMTFTVNKFYLFLLKTWFILTKLEFHICIGENIG